MWIDRLRLQAVDLWNAIFITSATYPVHRRCMPTRSRRQPSARRCAPITDRALIRNRPVMRRSTGMPNSPPSSISSRDSDVACFIDLPSLGVEVRKRSSRALALRRETHLLQDPRRAPRSSAMPPKKLTVDPGGTPPHDPSPAPPGRSASPQPIRRCPIQPRSGTFSTKNIFQEIVCVLPRGVQFIHHMPISGRRARSKRHRLAASIGNSISPCDG